MPAEDWSNLTSVWDEPLATTKNLKRHGPGSGRPATWPIAGVSTSRATPKPRPCSPGAYRKLGDIGKLSGDLEAARSDYLKAIAVGRESLKAHPADPESKTHLATALNDLGGVLHRGNELAAAGPLYAEAEQLFANLAEADPENANLRFLLVHAQYDHARLLRDLAHFTEAASAFRRAIDSLSRLHLERRSTLPPNDFLRVEILQKNLADCESASAGPGSAGSRSRGSPSSNSHP